MVKPRVSSILGIARGLNAIFMVVSLEEFKRISMCETVKKAWNILKSNL